DPAAASRLADRLANLPEATRRLATLAAVSSAFSDLLIGRPPLVAALLDAPSVEAGLFPGEPYADLIRVAGAYAAGDIHVPDAGRALSRVAESVIARAFDAAGPPMPMAVIAMGKLGGEELAFGSDLD